ncbi:MAG: PIN domain-containing protein [Firmicutes bacterium]|nr:PIN domain-containing protein [Bacillota bacterium]
MARLFRVRWLTVYGLTWPIAEKASRLARRYPGGKRNSPHDCAYVATALFAGAPLVFTLDDHRIRRFASNTEGITVQLPTSKESRKNSISSVVSFEA